MQTCKVYMTESVAECIYRIHRHMDSRWETNGKEFYAVLVARRGRLNLITDIRLPVQTISGASVRADKHSLAQVVESLSEGERCVGSYHRHPNARSGFFSAIDDELLELHGHQLSSDLLTWEEGERGSPIPALDLCMGEGKTYIDGTPLTGKDITISGASLKRRPISRAYAIVNADDQKVSFYGRALVRRYCLVCRSSQESVEELDVKIVPGEPCSLEGADLDAIMEENFRIHVYQVHYGNAHQHDDEYVGHHHQVDTCSSDQQSQQTSYSSGSQLDRILNEISILSRRIDRLLNTLEGNYEHLCKPYRVN